MDSRRFELQNDLEDLDRLLQLASRENSKTVLVNERLRLSHELSLIPVTEKVTTVGETSDKTWKAIDKFAWEQTDDEVKIYVTCFEGFKTHPKDQLVLESSENSVCASVVDFKGVNYRLKFPKLCKDIKGARTTVKSNGFSLTLKKKDKGHWESVTPKKSLIAKDEEESKDAEPGDSLMKMMKNLYEEGDDDMKRTIAEAWSKSKDKPSV
jgi:calcyclin binding protein